MGSIFFEKKGVVQNILNKILLEIPTHSSTVQSLQWVSITIYSSMIHTNKFTIAHSPLSEASRALVVWKRFYSEAEDFGDIPTCEDKNSVGLLDEHVAQILSYLDAKSLCAVGVTCHEWNSLSESDLYWVDLKTNNEKRSCCFSYLFYSSSTFFFLLTSLQYLSIYHDQYLIRRIFVTVSSP
jgi:hypothetical protein